ncbi:MAG: hypothetical protein KF895_02705 [Parvibaculum sp.]|nr:hypothetical protein [Parvibaculum sp.]
MINLGVILELVDRVSAPARRIAASARRLNADLGFSRIASSAANVGKSFQAVGRDVSTMAKRIVAGVGLVGGALFALTKRAANAGDAAGKSAQRVGMTSREWQRAAYAAELSGGSAEIMEAALVDLNKRTVMAVRGNKEAQESFRALGISLLDNEGKVKSTSTLLAEISERYANMADDQRKAAYAEKLFGGAGRTLIPLLNSGAAGLREMGDEAERLGRVIGDEAIEQSTEFNDNLSRLFAVLAGIGNIIAGYLLPIINPLLVSFREWVIANRELIDTGIADFIRSLPGYIETVLEVLRGIRSAFAPFLAALRWVSDLVGPANAALLIMGVLIGGKLVFSIAKLIFAFGGLGKAIALTTFALGRMAIGGLISMLGHLFLALKMGAGIMGVFNAVLIANPIGLVVVAATALAGAAYLIYRNWGDIVPFFADALSSLGKIFSGFVEIVVGLFTLDFTRAFEGLKSFLTGWVDWFSVLFRPVLAIVEGIGSFAAKAGKFIGLGGDDTPPGAPTGAAAVPVAARSEVGGELRIGVDDERIRVKKVKADNPRVPISVDTGKAMAS